MKAKLGALLTQATQLKRRLTNLVLEEPNKIFLNGLHRSMYLRMDEILDDFEFLARKPHLVSNLYTRGSFLLRVVSGMLTLGSFHVDAVERMHTRGPFSLVYCVRRVNATSSLLWHCLYVI